MPTTTRGMTLDAALRHTAAEVEAALQDLLPVVEGGEARLIEAMRYSALGGGKRMRAFMVMEAASLLNRRTGAIPVLATNPAPTATRARSKGKASSVDLTKPASSAASWRRSIER